jgi:hypothetical protein
MLRRPVLLTLLTAVLVTALALFVGFRLLRPGGPPLAAASVSAGGLSPNADGDDDAVTLTYSLRRAASLSIYFEDPAGQRFYFRQDEAREPGDHTVRFGGVVEGFRLPGDAAPADFDGQVLRRVLPDGSYTWVVTAVDAQGQSNQVSGVLTIAQADTTLPLLMNFTVSPTLFSPNQDGIDDRATINLYLTKEVPEGGLRVYLLGPDGTRLPIAEGLSQVQPGQGGLHTFDYDAGIDQGIDPPVNGAYTVRAEAEDALGQRVSVETRLQIVNGGLPRAEISRGEVQFSSTSVISGTTLYFELVVDNYGSAPLRTTGPASGFVYESMALNANSLGEYEESGAWRVGLHCQTCKSDYPWRWALGTPDTLTLIPDSNGNPQYYLMPGQRAVITGGIVLDEVVPSRNPQDFWAGLIHEDVEVVNNRVDPRAIEIVAP